MVMSRSTLPCLTIQSPRLNPFGVSMLELPYPLSSCESPSVLEKIDLAGQRHMVILQAAILLIVTKVLCGT